ncbi:I78 family peptidase inhibitor [Sphingomonas naphthae]|uniref:I78 family peptidase inhibitor n=1 Tax=Sphingomonas naphthae TaxID=1813468 RepID=A0ABY7TRD8_9SPHN|nr:I78 family peptidase inhibitor [Sphingomonas naphthae]WCT75207.1 I78 family peptidase inhibitor [Sphingomonas naphthae]
MRAIVAGGVVLAGLSLSACVTPRAAPPAGACNAAKAQGFVGNAASEALAEDARKAAGAQTVRILTPGQIVTMEFRAGRLNVNVDESGHVSAIRCG